MDKPNVNKMMPEIFEHLYKENKPLYEFSGDKSIERMFSVVNNDFEYYKERFEEIGFILEKHPFFIFLTQKESKSNVKKTLEKLRKWSSYRKILDLVYFKSISEVEEFTYNKKIQKAQVLVSLESIPTLRGLLMKLPEGIESRGLDKIVDNMFSELCNWCVLKEISKDEGTYMITGFVEYFEDLLNKIVINETEDNHETT